MFRPFLAAALLVATPAAARQLTPAETAQVDKIVADALKSSGVLLGFGRDRARRQDRSSPGPMAIRDPG